MRYRVTAEGRVALLASDEIVIGRSAYCTLALDHPSVSRVHACIQLVGDEITIEDSKSRNGTFVNGVRIAGTQRVWPGDNIRIGQVPIELAPAPQRRSAETHDDAGGDTLIQPIQGLK